jgi:branched-chain amino acid transport system permease protein
VNTRKRPKNSLTGSILWLVVVAILATMPFWASKMWIHLAIEIYIIALLSMSLNMILGRAGLPSLGHACFYAIGGYTFTMLLIKLSLPFVVCLICAPLMGAIFAVVIGYFSIRLSGLHFAILTLGFAQLVWAILHKWYTFTGGDDGITGIPLPAVLQGTAPLYYLVFAILVVCLIFIRVIQNSPFGQTIVAIRENRDRVTFSGLKVWQHLLFNFVIAGFFAGIAGALYAIFNRAVFPDMGYWPTSAAVVLMCILGGVGVFIGPLVGAAIIMLLEHYISMYTYYWQMVLGCLIVALVMFVPSGICGFIHGKMVLGSSKQSEKRKDEQ